MSVNVTCPSCQVVTAVPPEVLGRTGRCNRCGARIRLASPVAERLDPPAAPVPVAEAVPEAVPAPQPDPLSDWSAVVQDDPAPPGERRGAKRQPDDREPRRAAPAGGSNRAVLLAVLAVVGVVGGATAGALITHAVTAPDARKPVEQAAKPAPQPPARPAPKPAPKPEPKVTPEPDLPEPPRPEPKPPAPKPARPELTPDGIAFPAAVVNVVAGDGGANLVFHLATGELAFYDARAGKLIGTLSGVGPDSLLAAGRDRLFIGRRDGRIDSYNLRGGAAGPLARGAVTRDLIDLAVGSASDGPLVAVTRSGGRTHARLLDTETLTEIHPFVDDDPSGATRFPVPVDGPTGRAAVSADGRAVVLNDRWLVYTGGRYKGGRLTGASGVAPVPDGRGFVGNVLYAANGLRINVPPLPAGTLRQYVPAPGGPFVLSAESARGVGVALRLHLGTSALTFSELPGGDALAEWVATDPMWASKIHQRVVFVPDPGAVVVVPPGATAARVFPVDMAAVLERAGRSVMYTSVPPALAHPNRPYAYQVTMVSRQGPPALSLASGPAGMTLDPTGLLRWPAPDPADPVREVRVFARVGGRVEVQQFALEFPADDRVAVAPKKEPPNPFDKDRDPPVRPPLPPKKDPPKVEPPPAPVAPPVGRLVVTSDPPTQATAGAKFEYSPAVEAERGAGAVTLDYGPEGMTFAGGKLTWDVPAALAGQEVRVILTVSDAAGQEVFHTLRLKVVAPKP